MRRPARALLVLLILSALLIGSHPLRQATLTLLRLPLTVVNTVLSIVRTLPQLPSLLRTQDQLRQELLQSQLELAQLREVVRRDREEQLLGAVLPAGVLATVVGRSMLPTQHTILLNRGRRDSLALESAVIDAAGVVGRVSGLSQTTAVVTLLTDADSRVAAMVERSRETGLLIGRAHGLCELTYLDVDADVQEGDRVITAGLGRAFPKGLLLGAVTRIIRDEALGSSTAWVRPAVRLGQVEQVWCLRPTDTR